MDDRLERQVMSKVMWRLIPFLSVLYVVAFVDRINVGFAALTMSKDLGLSPGMFGFGAGIFFVAYFLFEVPSNLILHRVGARRWVARVMVSWGLVSACFAFMTGPTGFYVLRFLLGAAEAGFFPGIILFITYWFPKRWRGRATAGFVVAIPVSSFIAAPISGFLLSLPPFGGLKAWQWMFLLEALPALLLGIVCLFYLTDRPEQARWLDDEERAWLIREMKSETTAGPHQSPIASALRALVSPPVLLLALVYFGLTTGLYGIELWLPQIVKSFGFSALETGFISATPYLVAVTTMGAWAAHSDRTHERYLHVAIACGFGGAALAAAGLSHGLAAATVGFLALAVAGVMAARPPFWAIPSDFLKGSEAAAGIAAINAIGNLGGFFGPSLIGWAREVTGNFTLGLMISAVSLLLSAALALFLKRMAGRDATLAPAT